MKWQILYIVILTFLIEDSNATEFDSTLQSPSDTLTISVLGTGIDARFEPVRLQVSAGDVLRFEVFEGLHTVTAYHPENRRPLRIPEDAKPFHSGPLSKGDVWQLTLLVEGVYDYFCLPHELMGHAGRIVVGPLTDPPEYENDRLPEAVIKRLKFNLENH